MNSNDFFVEDKEELRRLVQIEKMLKLPLVQAIERLKQLENIQNVDHSERFTLSNARFAFLNEMVDEPSFEGGIDRKEFRDFIVENYLFDRFFKYSYQELNQVC
ncbi:hypothetical protein [Ligilactobacillus faecis]|uniref:Uncharacterized protein n=1 Tax=Ligilactobacillus faecis TaxID=762833 RepID=A0ABV4DRN5_9LACO|nr:hypothetical protein [Ligilactobacillus faecis]WGN89543.1 hypothetical protein QFX10_00085 [Ligilactobacillus faecis]